MDRTTLIRRCFAIDDGERCNNNTLEGLKWCRVHNLKCKNERNKYKSVCENIAKEETVCRNIKNIDELTLIELDEYIKDYQKIITQSDLCISSRNKFENKCIHKNERNQGHIDFKNNLRQKKIKCENIIQELIERSNNIKSELKKKNMNELEIDEPILDKNTNTNKKKKKRSVKKSEGKKELKEDTDDFLDKIIKKNHKINEYTKYINDINLLKKKIIDNYKEEIKKEFNDNNMINGIISEYVKTIVYNTNITYLSEIFDIISVYDDKILNEYLKKAINIYYELRLMHEDYLIDNKLPLLDLEEVEITRYMPEKKSIALNINELDFHLTLKDYSIDEVFDLFFEKRKQKNLSLLIGNELKIYKNAIINNIKNRNKKDKVGNEDDEDTLINEFRDIVNNKDYKNDKFSKEYIKNIMKYNKNILNVEHEHPINIISASYIGYIEYNIYISYLITLLDNISKYGDKTIENSINNTLNVIDYLRNNMKKSILLNKSPMIEGIKEIPIPVKYNENIVNKLYKEYRKDDHPDPFNLIIIFMKFSNKEAFRSLINFVKEIDIHSTISNELNKYKNTIIKLLNDRMKKPFI
jgi:hypothetical protein